MKIRIAFVANSSSSSFIVGFPKVPTSVKEVQDMLFNEDQDMYPNPYVYRESVKNGDGSFSIIEKEAGWPVSQAARSVYEQMIKQVAPMSDEMIKDELQQGNVVELTITLGLKEEYLLAEKVYNSPGFFKKTWDEQQFICDEYNKKRKDLIEQVMPKLREGFGDFVYYFTYSDNNGAFCSSMEHGTLFDRLPHIKISKH